MALTKITGEGLGTSINSTNTSGNSTLGLISGTSNSSVINLGDTDASNVGQVKYHHGVNSMVLRTNSTDKVTLDSTGNMLFNQSGTGIYLGTTSATASNLLDDYEEGTWTATLTGTSSDPSTAVTLSSARYTKIGRLVFCQFQFSNVNTTGASGSARVSGLPFTAGTSYATGNVMTYIKFSFSTSATNISPYVESTNIKFYTSSNNAGWAEITHNAGTGAYLACTVTYETS